MQQRLKTLYAELKELEEDRQAIQDTRRSPQLSGDVARSNTNASPVELAAVRLEKIEKEITAKRSEIEEEKAEVLALIDKLTDADLRVIYYYRLVECMKWDQISRITGEESDALRIRFRRSLSRIQGEHRQEL
jgi:uncharacterized coiled-coil protein SlyX